MYDNKNSGIKPREEKKMEYILMRHEDVDRRIDPIYDGIKAIGAEMGKTLTEDQMIEMVASALVDPEELHKHEEVRELFRRRKQERQSLEEMARKDGIAVAPIRPNRLLEAGNSIKQLSTEYPSLTIAYNDTLRTKVTAKAVSNVAGGTLVKGNLEDEYEVSRWMRSHEGEDGLAVIVTHAPAIGELVGENARNCDAFLVGKEHGRYYAVKMLNP